MGNNRIEQVREFEYLGVILDSQNNIHGEINIRFSTANRCYFSLADILKSKLISKNTKEQLYIIYVRRPVLTYACAIWTTTKSNEEKLKRFERKILRKIRGPVYNSRYGK